ncbi:MAG: hypothetical protein EOP84_04560 [Verrucomicrobiaceae bacterium]|nr:MAG: hypothetical protein EOP84_04560 [Verrucomicrobiaceae bacterium]
MTGGAEVAASKEGNGAPEAATLTALTISISATLKLLDQDFRTFADGFAEGRYALWLGSGISRGRFPMLPDLIVKVLEYLRSNAEQTNRACPYQEALMEALQMAQFDAKKIAKLNLAASVEDWPKEELDSLKGYLTGKYADFLGIEVKGKDADVLVWEGVDVVGTYANDKVEPDLEHLLIAALILEGAVSDIASANWDGLIEKALTKLTGVENRLAVCVKSEDVQDIAGRPVLTKFHGCALRAKAKPDAYRKFIVGRSVQIAEWNSEKAVKAIRARLLASISEKPALMLGLSVQDFNIQNLFGAAKENVAWPWPGDRPSYVFSEDMVTQGQKNLLQIVYKNDYKATTSDAIQKSSLLRAFGKQLLTALLLYCLADKLVRIGGVKASLKPGQNSAWLRDGIIAVRDAIAAADTDDHFAFGSGLLASVSRAKRISALGEAGIDNDTYQPLSAQSATAIGTSVELQASGLPELSTAVGILGQGIRTGHWQLRVPATPNKSSPLAILKTETREVPVWVAATGVAEDRLYKDGYVNDRDPAILVRGQPPVERYQRSPKPLAGRHERGVIEIHIESLAGQTGSGPELLEAFRQAAVL